MTAIDTRVAHKKTSSEFYVVVIRGCFLAVSAAAARMGFLDIHDDDFFVAGALPFDSVPRLRDGISG